MSERPIATNFPEPEQRLDLLKSLPAAMDPNDQSSEDWRTNHPTEHQVAVGCAKFRECMKRSWPPPSIGSGQSSEPRFYRFDPNDDHMLAVAIALVYSAMQEAKPKPANPVKEILEPL
jgi:hypothetical protein